MQCFACNREVPDNSNVCPYCGQRLVENPVLPQQTVVQGEPVEMPAMAQPQVPPQQAAYYAQPPVGQVPPAGKKVKAPKPPKAPKEKKGAPKWVVVLLSILLVLAIAGLGVGGYFFYYMNKSYDSWVEYGKAMEEKYSQLEASYISIDKEKKDNDAMLNIYKKYIVWVGAEESTHYHADYNCSEFTDSSFRAFNKTTADEFGYIPCEKCVK